MTSMPLSLKNVTVGHRKPLTAGVDLDVAPSEFVTLMGENGIGKSTLIDCLMGLASPLSGEILFWGKPNEGRHRSIINQSVGWVISQHETYPLFTTIDGFFDSIAPLYPSWNWDVCERLCRDFELDTKKRLVHLSMGEHSKVRLVKALSFEPRLIILDELTANLSPASKEVLLAALLDMFASREMSVLYVSHSKEEAIMLSDRVLYLDREGLKTMGGK